MKLGDRKTQQAERLIGTVLDAQDGDIVIARPADCGVLYMNDCARQHLGGRVRNEYSCKLGYSRLFPGLCARCAAAGEPAVFETPDTEARYHAASVRTIDWLDGKPAVFFSLRDVHNEREDKKKLYQLAYIDQLTDIPNRRRLRSDFDKIQPRIAQGSLQGALAIFDLDYFKNINDTYGHNTGDIMLKRLTDHLQANDLFRDHLYRLGGDEFVLFYTEEAERHPSFEALRAHYDELLQGALLAYTMPTIELACTISMGIAFFPQHGELFSELLRKADIALYKAKAGGRNQKAIFEDRYDTARKFTDLYINIQPILSASGKTFGYEMIDSGNGEFGDDEVNLTEADRTMEVIGLAEMAGPAKYFIPYSNQLFSDAVLGYLPMDKFVVQVYPSITYRERELALYRALKAKGYSLAVAGLRSSNAKPALMELADYFKFHPGVNEGTAAKIISGNPGKIFIATGVDAAPAFEDAKRRNFRLFQGFFFNQQPIVRKTKEINPVMVNYLRLLKLSCADGYMDFKEISAIISSDVALSYKLLRILNSAAVGLRNVTSINMAVTYLGEQNLKKWIALMGLRGVGADQPVELVRSSLIRARFGEQLAPHFRVKRDPRPVFLVGLLSLLHIALEKTREAMLEDIPVADNIRQSLLQPDGPFSDILSFFSHYEYGNWDEVGRYGEEHKLSGQLLNDSYVAAVKWYNDLAEA